jgi:type II secretory pathway pseudopilin PulG
MLLQIMKNRGGFTLVELLLYAAMLSIIIFSVGIFLNLTLQSRTKNQVIAEVEQQGILAMQRMMQVVRNSNLINSPATGASGSTLSVNMPQAALSPTVFALSGGAVTITEGTGATVSLTNNLVSVTGLTFTNVSRASTPGTVRVQFTITYINNSGRNEYDYSKTFDSDASLRDN